MIRFRSTHPAVALPGRAWRFVDGIADVPEELAAELRDVARRRPWLRIVEEGPVVQAPPAKVRRERRAPRLVIVDSSSGS